MAGTEKPAQVVAGPARPPRHQHPGVRALWLVWSALWRAQAVHLAVFVFVPLLIALCQAALGIVLLPFTLGGGSAGRIDLVPVTAPFLQAGCWVALAPCDWADRSLIDFSQGASGPATGSPAIESFMPWPASFTVRHAWFAAWLAWFAVFLVRRERRLAR